MFVEAKDELLKQWKALTDEYSKFKAETPLLFQGDEAINLHQDRQVDFERERVKLRKELADLDAKIRTTEATVESGQDLESVLLLAEQDGSRMIQDQLNYRQELQREKYMSLLLEEEELLRRYGADHPDVLTVQAKIKRFKEVFPEVVTDEGARRSSTDVSTFVRNYLSSLKQRHSQIESRIGSLDQFFADEEAASKALRAGPGRR